MRNANQATRRFWITGASSGIGHALATRFARRGDRIAVSARSADRLDQLAQSEKNITVHALDVTVRADVHAVIEKIEQQAPIDVAVLNAGIWHMMDAAGLDVDRISSALAVNYLGTVYALEKLVPAMRARGRGHIVIMASVAGFRGLPRSIAYGPTKAALINLAETLKTELEPDGIDVSVINPGFVDTPATRKNPFAMPDIISADQAAKYIADGIDRRKTEIIFPARFAVAMKILRILPGPVFFWLMRRLMAR